VLEDEIWIKNENGVPQGGIISPIIMNFVLNGLETAAFVSCKKTQLVNIKNIVLKKSNVKGKKADHCKYIKVEKDKQFLKVSRILVRYADDFIIITTDKKDIPTVQGNITKFLHSRGVQINEEKFQIFK